MTVDVLIGYSACNLTRAAFERAGCRAWTCDTRPARDGNTERHLQCDIWEALFSRLWAGAVLHPMCTYLTISAAWAYGDPDFEKYPSVGYHQRVKPGTLTGEARRRARAPKRSITSGRCFRFHSRSPSRTPPGHSSTARFGRPRRLSIRSSSATTRARARAYGCKACRRWCLIPSISSTRARFAPAAVIAFAV